MNNINLIAAVSLNGVIGDSSLNHIPWYLPSDLKYFKNVTFSHTVVMGVKTYRSIGRPLPNRKNVVITRNKETADQLLADGVDATYSSVHEAEKSEWSDFFAIGGQMIYEETIKMRPRKMYITVVGAHINGDVRFPINGSRFLEDRLILQNGDVYTKDSETDWDHENGLDFKHTIFKINT